MGRSTIIKTRAVVKPAAVHVALGTKRGKTDMDGVKQGGQQCSEEQGEQKASPSRDNDISPITAITANSAAREIYRAVAVRC